MKIQEIIFSRGFVVKAGSLTKEEILKHAKKEFHEVIDSLTINDIEEKELKGY